MLLKGSCSAKKLDIMFEILSITSVRTRTGITLEIVEGDSRQDAIKKSKADPASMTRTMQKIEELNDRIHSICKLDGKVIPPPPPIPAPAPHLQNTYYEPPEENKISINEAKRRREVAGAFTAELSLAKEREQLANIDDLMEIFEDALVNVRAKLVSMPSRLSGILSHQDEDSVSKLLDADVNDMLEVICEYE